MISGAEICPCEIHTLGPISTWATLSIQTDSPIQEFSNRKRPGYFTTTPGFTTTFFPMCAPNTRRQSAAQR